MVPETHTPGVHEVTGVSRRWRYRLGGAAALILVGLFLIGAIAMLRSDDFPKPIGYTGTIASLLLFVGGDIATAVFRASEVIAALIGAAYVLWVVWLLLRGRSSRCVSDLWVAGPSPIGRFAVAGRLAYGQVLKGSVIARRVRHGIERRHLPCCRCRLPAGKRQRHPAAEEAMGGLLTGGWNSVILLAILRGLIRGRPWRVGVNRSCFILL